MQEKERFFKPIAIVSWGAVSPLGKDRAEVRAAYLAQDRHFLQKGEEGWQGRLNTACLDLLETLRKARRAYRRLDPVVLQFLYAAEQATAGQLPGNTALGILVGSSRGATQTLEQSLATFYRTGKVPSATSPATTLGNLASWTAQHLAVNGPQLEFSITCSTAFHALLQAIPWLQSGRYYYFLAGGSEAPLTPFTFAQMQALRIYAPPAEVPYPSRPLDPSKEENGMVLGAGAAAFLLSSNAVTPKAWLIGIGYGVEAIASPTGVSEQGIGFRQSMQEALRVSGLQTVDVVITHSPGTLQGDASELAALKAVFGARLPFLTTNKWKIGHTLGASGGLSLEMALIMLEEGLAFPLPYVPQAPLTHPTTIMINALGFGGNAISLIVSKGE